MNHVLVYFEPTFWRRENERDASATRKKNIYTLRAELLL